jgi:peroxisomal 2,4-dienoyl-CoA reductase
VAELGGIDFVIAGAAGNFVVPLSKMTPNAFKSVMDIDLLGSFNTAQATMPHLVRARPFAKSTLPTVGPTPAGRIVFVSATFHYTGLPLQAHMSAAKAGVDSLMASVALEYGPLGVTSNVIAPGPIENTDGMARLAGKFDSGDPSAAAPGGVRSTTKGTTDSGNVKDDGAASAASPLALRKGIPSGRWGAARDIADATVYLFSEAGSYVNGHALVVDGASWRRQGGAPVGIDESMQYPDYLLEGKVSSHVKDGRKSKL